MKSTLKTLIAMAIAATALFSCKKSDKEPGLVLPLNDNSLPSGAITGFKLVNKTTSYLEYSLDIAVFRDSRNMENQLKKENFLNDTLQSGSLKYFFSLISVDKLSPNLQKPYSAVMLMDQSGSILTTDPLDYRLDAANAFCRRLGANDNISLWSFQGDSSKQYGTGFTRDTGFLISKINGLNGHESGNTPLYKSQNNVVNYCFTNATNTNKAVLTFTDGADNNSAGVTSPQVVANAIAKNVNLFNIGLDAAEAAILSRQALATGGSFMFAKDARQLISMFGNLGNLLNVTATYYHTTWRVTRSSGNFTTGTLTFYVTVQLPYGGTVTVPFSVDY
jgi:von Willebrand factor type A domain